MSYYRLPLNERFSELDEVLWGMQIASAMDFLISKDVRSRVKGQRSCNIQSFDHLVNQRIVTQLIIS